MDNRFEQPELLAAFAEASPSRVRRWVYWAGALWLLLMVVDWGARFSVFRWQDQWLPRHAAVARAAVQANAAQSVTVPAKTGGGLTQMVPIPGIAARYEEFHPAYVEYRDADGYCNSPLPPGAHYSVVMIGDSFMLSLGTQNVAQALAAIGGIQVYNHARYGAGPFQELRKFIVTPKFDPPPRLVIWNLSARELGAPLFERQPVDHWFDYTRAFVESGQKARPSGPIRWEILAPSVLRKAMPNTSLLAYYGRGSWARIKLGLLKGWPRDVLGVEDPRFGPMLFYRENLRMLPLLTPEANAGPIVQTVTRVATRLKEQNIALLVLLVPEKEQIHRRALPEADQPGLACGVELLGQIESGLEAAGVPVVNLMPVFQAATQQGQLLYWRDDTHWNDAGIHLAAEELWRAAEPLLK